MADDSKDQKKINRRKFLKRALYGGVGACAVLGAYPFVEAGRVRVTRRTIPVANLPPAFAGTTVGLLSDIHHGLWVGLDFVRDIVRQANLLGADVFALTGDYVYRGAGYIDPCIGELSKLRAEQGVYAVLGNHDYWDGASRTRAALKRGGIREIKNTGVWLERGGARLRLCGVDDLWEGKQDLDAALADCTDRDAAVLLSHNPDYVEEIRDPRVGLVLSGHTHGGQVNVPFLGPPLVPSRYGQKYASGLVKTPHTQVYVSRGLGTISIPIRFNCRPEIVLVELAAA